MLTWENTSPEIKKKKPSIAFIPVGSTEQHGPHLPLCTDTLIADKVSQKIAEHFNGYLLPALPFGTCIENMEGPGSISLSFTTLASVIQDVVDSLARTGFQKAVIMNFHGGNFILPVVTRDINFRRKDIKVFFVESWLLKFTPNSKKRLAPEKTPLLENDLHGGYSETSFMLHVAKKLVQMNRARNTNPTTQRSDLNHKGMISATGGVGTWGPSKKANPRDGKILFQASIDANVARIKDLLAETD